ncbi:tRNA1(Val) (adenine(37)-N6)-methyltransferase [Mucilaginibacter panaciglaebae]|uniref:tRNA1(Val) (adenine(37)-N6)-methyltransferase n=1 Tax=Mucilaginibacter panaciglaebae TaxID=502331 RepID=A0ABP7X2R4_9SPHI
MFRFKQFTVDQTNCAMKINTDGVLLGVLAGAKQPKTILDIGTGTGVIALMLAQRFPEAKIDAVEIDELAAATARQNFANSPFVERLDLYAGDFEDFFKDQPQKKYDLIVSNPPFYINSLQSPGEKKKLAKHTDVDFFERLIKSATEHLTEIGLLWLILPVNTAELINSLITVYGLHLNQRIEIKSFRTSGPHREILSFGFNKVDAEVSNFVIYEEKGIYHSDYKHKLKPYFINF